MRTKGEEYRIPIEVKDAILAINNETSMRIIEYLMNSEKLYFPEIKSKIKSKLEFGELLEHMTILSNSGLVDRYTSTLDDKTDENSFFKLSPFAIRFINNMLSSVEDVELVHKDEEFWQELENLRNISRNERSWRKTRGLYYKPHKRYSFNEKERNSKYWDIIPSIGTVNKYNEEQKVMDISYSTDKRRKQPTIL